MGQAASDLARKLIAVAVLALAAYVLFKVVLGIVASLAWIAVVVVALIALVWAIRTL